MLRENKNPQFGIRNPRFFQGKIKESTDFFWRIAILIFFSMIIVCISCLCNLLWRDEYKISDDKL